MSSRYHDLFPQYASVIGMIALPPLQGYAESEGLDAIIERALTDLDTLQSGGVDGVCVENDYDHPHQITVGPEIVAAFTRVAREVALHAKVPVGLQVLLNDWRASIDIAKAVSAQFVRLDFFVDRVRIAAGIIEPEPDAVTAYRKLLRAEDVALLTDIHVKYSELLEPGKSLTTSTLQAIAHGADAVIVSGKATGEGPALEHLREVRAAATDFPVLVGSGTTPVKAPDLFRYADGAIVGTALKNSTSSTELVVPQRVTQLMDVIRTIRQQRAQHKTSEL